jgi:hypothetical protein
VTKIAQALVAASAAMDFSSKSLLDEEACNRIRAFKPAAV